MTDPIYNFVPGQGWVVTPFLTMKCGTKVTYEFRFPKKGERFASVSRRWDSEFCFNGEPVIPKWESWIPTVRITDCPDCPIVVNRHYDDVLYCVLVPL